MLTITVLVLVIVVGLIDCNQIKNFDYCGLTKKPARGFSNHDPRVIGGKTAEPAAWPWQVVIHIKINETYSKQCGGSVITREFVLSAAHCYPEGDYDEIRVVAGEYDLIEPDDGEQERKAVSSFVHPKFDARRPRKNDLVLFKLNYPLEFTEKVGPICLPVSGDDYLAPGVKATLTGWGKADGGFFPAILRQVDLPVVDADYCQSGTQNDIQICTYERTDGANGCFGDSGGPLMVMKNGRWYQHGIASHVGFADCRSSTVFTRTSAYLDWIARTVQVLSRRSTRPRQIINSRIGIAQERSDYFSGLSD